MLKVLRLFTRHHRKLAYVVIGAILVLLIYSLSNFGERLDLGFQRRQEESNPVLASTSVPLEPQKSTSQAVAQDFAQVYDDPGAHAAAETDDVDEGTSGPADRAAGSDPLPNDFEEVDVETPTIPNRKNGFGSTENFPPQFTGPENTQQKAIVDAFLHAWKAYRKYAWGLDELRPLSKSGQQWMGVGLTIVDSLDTIVIMGLTEEYKVAREWVAESLNFEYDADVQLFEMTIRTLGGLLSAYHLSGDELFLNKAIELGSKFTTCFSGATKIPCNRMNLKRLQPTFVEISTAETASIQLEFRDLSRSSNDSKFEDEVAAVSDHLHGLQKLDGLVSCFLNPVSGLFQLSSTVSAGASADSYYEYLLKQWIQTGKTRDWLKEDYLLAVEGIKKHLLRYSVPNRFGFVGSLPSAASIGQVRHEMEHLTCFLPGTLALGVIHGLNKSHLQLATELTHTCYKMYELMPTKLSPEVAVMNTDPNVKEDISTQYNTRYNLQRPETVESIFYMYRATKNQMYRDWGWNIFQAFEKYTKLEVGYASIDNVLSTENPGYKDKMETFYLAETLKYLYLLFSDDPNLLALDKYVFNTEAHPLPVYSS